MSAVVQKQRQRGQSPAVTDRPVAKGGPYSLLLHPRRSCFPAGRPFPKGHLLVENAVADPKARVKVLIERIGICSSLHEGHGLAAADHVTFKTLRDFDVADADRANHGDLGHARPHFIDIGNVL